MSWKFDGFVGNEVRVLKMERDLGFICVYVFFEQKNV